MKPKYSFINILTGSDLSTRRLALMEIKSLKSGPVIWLTGAVHGDEIGGIFIIQEIFKRLRKSPLLKGKIYAFPLMNPVGFENVTRGIAITEEDLNRSFPGDKEGTLAERIAAKIFTNITESKPDIVLDIHNDWLNTIPWVEIDPNPGPKNKRAYEKAKLYAFKIGLPIINELEDAAQAQNLQRSLSGSLLLNNIPALTLEVGGASTVSSIAREKDIQDGTKAIWDLLTFLGMVKPFKAEFNNQIPDNYKNKILRYSHQPDASKSGIIKYLVKPGQIVKKDQPVAKIYNVFGKLLETLTSQENSLILGHWDYSVSYPGAELISFAII
jgi:predicted deacylase